MIARPPSTGLGRNWTGIALAALFTAGALGATSAQAATAEQGFGADDVKPRLIQQDRVADLDDDWRKKVRDDDEDDDKAKRTKSNSRDREEAEPRRRYNSDTQRERSSRPPRRSYSYGS